MLAHDASLKKSEISPTSLPSNSKTIFPHRMQAIELKANDSSEQNLHTDPTAQ